MFASYSLKGEDERFLGAIYGQLCTLTARYAWGLISCPGVWVSCGQWALGGFPWVVRGSLSLPFQASAALDPSSLMSALSLPAHHGRTGRQREGAGPDDLQRRSCGHREGRIAASLDPPAITALPGEVPFCAGRNSRWELRLWEPSSPLFSLLNMPAPCFGCGVSSGGRTDPANSVQAPRMKQH